MRESGTRRVALSAVYADQCLCGPLLWPTRLLGPGEPPETLQHCGSAGGAEHPAGPLPGRRNIRPKAGPAVSHRAAPGEAGRGVSEAPSSIRMTQPNDGMPVRNPPEPPWAQQCTERSLSTTGAGLRFLLNIHVSCRPVLENANSIHLTQNVKLKISLVRSEAYIIFCPLKPVWGIAKGVDPLILYTIYFCQLVSFWRIFKVSFLISQ